jgi:adenylate cyclase
VNVWWDQDIPPEAPWEATIERQLGLASLVIVAWSPAAVASENVRAEARRARQQGRLLQVFVESCEPPLFFGERQGVDLCAWNGDLAAPGWRKVVASIAELTGGPVASPSAPSAPTPRKSSICVLPFSNMSGDPEQEYFSDWISEDIITDLSKVSALSVVARNTAFGFKGKSPNVKEVAHQLGVSHVLEGSVRKAGNRLRITAQLIDGAAGDHIWAERYDRDLTDIFALQDEISEAIVKALKLKLLPGEKQAIERRGTDSVEAYDLYLMARSYWLTGNEGDPRQLEAIEHLCRRAVEIDPGYAQAWALLASGQLGLHRVFGREGDGGAAALDRALALDPDLAEARAQKAMRLSNAGRREEAAAEIAVALRLDPESYDVNFRAACISYYQGRLAEAVPYFEKATALAETDIGAPFMLVSCYTGLGDGENTRRVARIALERAEKVVAADRSNGTAMDVGVGALAALARRIGPRTGCAAPC